MKVLILGGAGKTGRLVTDEAVRAGHEVSVLVRNAQEIDRSDIKVCEGDAADPTQISKAVERQDAVLDTIGGKTPFLPTRLEASVAKTVVNAMRGHRVRRLVVTSMVGVGDSAANTTPYERLLLATFLRGASPDKAAMEEAVLKSELDWTVLRPAPLVDEAPTGDVRVFMAGVGEAVHSISRADLAAFMVAELSTSEHLHQAITIATR